MSLKTQILLSRPGRDQFGDYDEDYIAYVPRGLSRAEKKEFYDAVAGFFDAEWPAWESFCRGKTSQQIWGALFHPHGKPAFSTWEKKRRDFVSLSEFLKYVLIEHRWPVLTQLRASHAAAARIIHRYPALSRYALDLKIGKKKPGR